MTVGSAVSLAAAASSAVVGLVLLDKRRRSPAPRSLAAWLLALAASRALAAVSEQSLGLADAVFWKGWELVPTSALPGLSFLVAQSFAAGKGNEGVAWCSLGWTAAVAPPLYVLAFHERLFRIPFGLERAHPEFLQLTTAASVLFAVMLLISVIGIATLEAMLRATAGSQRWRSKFLVLGIASYLGLSLYLESQTLLYSALSVDLEFLRSYASIVALFLILLALRRGQDFTIGIRPSAALVYRSLTLVVASGYLLVVGVVVRLSGFLGTDETLPIGILFVFFALVGLAVFLLSDQFRQGARRLLARNLYSPRYDYRKEWLEFTERTAPALTPSALCQTAVKFVTETFGVSSATIWIAGVDPAEEAEFGGSTDLTEGEVASRSFIARSAERLDSVRRRPRRSHRFRRRELSRNDGFSRRPPEVFAMGGTRYAVPLRASQHTLGVLTLSSRVTGESFSLEDVDLLIRLPSKRRTSRGACSFPSKWSARPRSKPSKPSPCFSFMT